MAGPNTRRARYAATRRETLLDNAAPAIFAFIVACAFIGAVVAIAATATR